jgi:hypothetical protein
MDYSEMREELIEYLHTLSDLEYQYRAWVNLEQPAGVEDCFDLAVHFIYLAVHFIYDDTTLASDPQSLINIILKNEDEVRLIKEVVKTLDSVFNDIGMEATDEEYILSSRWGGVLEAASQAYQSMKD